mmetsp:Transcript_5789/g.21073  ORF Transcript_5789/g.21073 Transcript_5789/m.21073 type:complete len:644 (-) Transcript_5789:986-2917(-)
MAEAEKEELSQPLLGKNGGPGSRTGSRRGSAASLAQSEEQVVAHERLNRVVNGIEWLDVSFTVPLKRGEVKRILDKCTGVLHYGELGCIIGPSGAGKTSLMTVLGGRLPSKRGLHPKSQVLLDGSPIEEKSKFKLAFVPQEDSMFAFLTPREALLLSARLRLPVDLTYEQRLSLVDELLKTLLLEKCADSMIGSVLVRGISGGEKKRTSIGQEIIINPSFIFLDEPTSGLDSTSAYVVIELLQRLAHKKGCGVLSTIHQPSSAIFELFDRVVLMADGMITYGGPNSYLHTFFETQGKAIPYRYNPADWVLHLMQTESAEKLKEIRDSWRSLGAELAFGRIGSADDEESQDIPRSPLGRSFTNLFKDSMPLEDGRRPGLVAQTVLLTQREARGVLRDTQTLSARFIVPAFLNLLNALIFWKIGTKDDLQSHAGALYQVFIGAMFGAAQPLLLTFPLERPVFVREYAGGNYSSTAYFISKTLVEVPLSLLVAIEIWCITYWAIEFQGNIVYLTLVTWALQLVAASTTLLISCLVPQAKAAMELAPLAFVPQLLFAGFFVKIDLIPSFLRWVQYLCFLKFAINLALIFEFGKDHCTKVLGDQCRLFLEDDNVIEGDWYIYLAIVLGLFVVLRLLALIALTLRAKAV